MNQDSCMWATERTSSSSLWCNKIKCKMLNL